MPSPAALRAAKSVTVDAGAAALAIFDLTRGLVARGIVDTRAFDVDREVAFVTALVWQAWQRKGKR